MLVSSRVAAKCAAPPKANHRKTKPNAIFLSRKRIMDIGGPAAAFR